MFDERNMGNPLEQASQGAFQHAPQRPPVGHDLS
jgi:hypothetical protein